MNDTTTPKPSAPFGQSGSHSANEAKAAAVASYQSASEALEAGKYAIAAEANAATDTAVGLKDRAAATLTDAKDRAAAGISEAKHRASDYADTASLKAKDLATSGKDKAAEAAAGLARLIEDSAPSVDARLGAQYGDYARSAAKSVSGFADTLDSKNVDELIESGKQAAKRNPVAAVGVAAVGAWLLSKLLRGPAGR